MNRMKAAQAEKFVRAISDNVDALYEGKVTDEEFDVVARRLWDQVANANAVDAVNDLLRKKEVEEGDGRADARLAGANGLLTLAAEEDSGQG